MGSCSGSFFALDRTSGDFGWVYDTRQDGERTEFHGTSIVTETRIVIATDDRRAGAVGHVYAFDRETGELQWKQPFDIGVTTDLTARDGVLYFATLTEMVVALDLTSGEPLWTFDAGSATKRFFTTSTPYVSDKRVFFGGIDGTVHALDRATGRKVWSRSLGARVSTAVTEIDGKLLVGTADNKLHLLRRKNGKTVATSDLPGLPFGRPVDSPHGIVAFMTGGRVLCLSPDLETVRWETRVETEWAAFRPVLLKDEVLSGADDGRVYGLALRDGEVVWSQDFHGPVTSLTDVGERGEFYVGTSQGVVFATRWSYRRASTAR